MSSGDFLGTTRRQMLTLVLETRVLRSRGTQQCVHGHAAGAMVKMFVSPFQMCVKYENSGFFFKLFKIFYVMGDLSACAPVCHLPVSSALGDQERVSGPLGLELQTLVT